MTSPSARPPVAPADAVADLPDGWTVHVPDESDTAELTALVRSAEQQGRGWPGSSRDDLLVEVRPPGRQRRPTRVNVVLCDPAGTLRAWGSAHDRASGRMLLRVVVSPQLQDGTADAVAASLFAWGERAALRVARSRGLRDQQIDSGAFADDARQHRWLGATGYEKVRTWWQMTRDVAPDDARGPVPVREGVRIRLVRRDDEGRPDQADLRTVHDILETAFADHFNSHQETFDEFVERLEESPGHRWDHWWVAELLDGEGAKPAGALVGSVLEGAEGAPDGSYVEYLGVLAGARGRGVATSLLATVVADAAERGRDRVGLEVDADSPTGAAGLYTSLGWRTSYVTESWHRHVSVDS